MHRKKIKQEALEEMLIELGYKKVKLHAYDKWYSYHFLGKLDNVDYVIKINTGDPENIEVHHYPYPQNEKLYFLFAVVKFYGGKLIIDKKKEGKPYIWDGKINSELTWKEKSRIIRNNSRS